MKEATVVFSRKGFLAKTISARDVSSREHARKLWPLVTTDEPLGVVTWVRPSFDDETGRLLRHSHFRRLPGAHEIPFARIFDEEESERYKATTESPEHATAKKLIAEALRARLQAGRAMPWSFKDPDASDFHLAGNLLLGAADVVTEREMQTVFGNTYRLDVGILSRTIRKGPILLGGIEIEWGHPFEGRKALISKSLAFPLISVDISGMRLAELTPEWADHALSETTSDSETHRRKTFIYLPDLLYPQHVQVTPEQTGDERHQFIVFAAEPELVKLKKVIPEFSKALGLPNGACSVSPVNAKSEQATAMLRRLGDIVGPDWPELNAHGCLLLTLNRPRVADEALQLMHLCIANLLLAHSDSLVGYSYARNEVNTKPEDDVWVHSRWNTEKKDFDRSRIAPKRLAEPHSRLKHWLAKFDQ